MQPRGRVARRARVSSSFQRHHRRREGAVVVVGVISIGARAGRGRRCRHRRQHRYYHRRAYRCRRCHDAAPAQVAESH
eukprot:7467158-Pyramimonas_sp.AAC.1